MEYEKRANISRGASGVFPGMLLEWKKVSQQDAKRTQLVALPMHPEKAVIKTVLTPLTHAFVSDEED